jgi:hypothetical protein
MIKPVDFAFNEETAASNTFMNRISGTQKEIQEKAIKEFDNAAKMLTDKGVNIIVFDKSKH